MSNDSLRAALEKLLGERSWSLTAGDVRRVLDEDRWAAHPAESVPVADRESLESLIADELANWVEDGPRARRAVAKALVAALLAAGVFRSEVEDATSNEAPIVFPPLGSGHSHDDSRALPVDGCPRCAELTRIADAAGRKAAQEVRASKRANEMEGKS
ncbi:MAG TPA: hypothetical protein VGH54_09820 [Mycobacterium sp.]|jgi:hypothetical protein|uniref:hypothetical protein n=1 Tax=Mycobacterium sp. TaxID=1785 RepID=UPI002F3E818A